MSSRKLSAQDLQAVFKFFGEQAVEYVRKTNTLAPACALVWMAPDTAKVENVNQFPTQEITELMQSANGRHKLAYAIRAMLNPLQTKDFLLPGKRPDLVIQIVLAAPTIGADSHEVILLLAHTLELTHVTAIDIPKDWQTITLPAVFDISSTPISDEAAIQDN